MPVRIADYRAIVMTYAQAKRPIFANVVTCNIHPRNLLARLSAVCVRVLILTALDHAKDATFTSHANSQGDLKRSDKIRLHTGTTSLTCRWSPLSSANASKPGPSRLNKAGVLSILPRRTHHHQQRLPVYKTLWPSLRWRQRQPKLKLKQPELKPPRTHREAGGPDKYSCHKPCHSNYPNSYYIRTSCAQPTHCL
ncbi:hypothetical protein MRX96_049083 [Rhipicephalus microplus]